MAAGAETLKRTPLYDRHAAAGEARAVRRLGDARPVRRDPRGAPRRAHEAGVFDVSHMGEIETRGPEAQAFLQRMLSNDVAKLAEGGAQYSVLAERTAASSTTSSPTGSAPTAT